MRWTLGAGTACLLLAAWWALAPIDSIGGDAVPSTMIALASPSAERTGSGEERPFDVDAFDVRLWEARPDSQLADEQNVQPPTESTPPTRLQLIGIIQEIKDIKAALYDSVADRLLIVAVGEEINEHTVVEISAESVTLATEGSIQTLTLIRPPVAAAQAALITQDAER
jgi:hypothetical protein